MTKLTKKQKDFLEEYAKNGQNGTQAALKTYNTDSPKVASVIAVENLAKPSIQSALEEAFPDKELFDLHREGLFDEDLVVRHKYLDTAYKLKGSYAAEKHANLNVNIDISKNEDIQALADKAAELLREKKLHGDTGTTDRT